MVPVAVVLKPKKQKILQMNKSTRLIITAAAMAGLYAGALAVKASAADAKNRPRRGRKSQGKL